MRKCTICERTYRGKGKLIFVSAKRGLRGVLACSECVKLTVRILIQPPGIWKDSK